MGKVVKKIDWHLAAKIYTLVKKEKRPYSAVAKEIASITTQIFSEEEIKAIAYIYVPAEVQPLFRTKTPRVGLSKEECRELSKNLRRELLKKMIAIALDNPQGTYGDIAFIGRESKRVSPLPLLSEKPLYEESSCACSFIDTSPFYV